MKGVQQTTTTDHTIFFIGTSNEEDGDKDGQGDQSVEAEASRHDCEGGGPKYCMWDKEGHCFDHQEQFGRDPGFVIFVQVEGGEQVPFCAELRDRQEAGGETSDLKEAGCRVFRDTVIQKNIENWKHK